VKESHTPAQLWTCRKNEERLEIAYWQLSTICGSDYREWKNWWNGNSRDQELLSKKTMEVRKTLRRISRIKAEKRLLKIWHPIVLKTPPV